MNKQLAEYFLDQVSNAFAFLVSEFGFSSPQLEINEDIHFAFVIFKAKNLAIELILDEKESDVTCKISRMINGKRTSDYAVDRSGSRVREHLSSLMRRRGINDPLFRKVTDLSLDEQIPVILEDFVQMLRKYGQDVLCDSSAALA